MTGMADLLDNGFIPRWKVDAMPESLRRNAVAAMCQAKFYNRKDGWYAPTMRLRQGTITRIVPSWQDICR